VDVYEEADLYCAAFSWPLEPEVEFLLGLVPGARTVLEPFCGNARYGPFFVERGVEYHGLDRSRTMLDRGAVGPGIRLHEADATAFDLPGVRFDLAFVPVNSIRHLTDEGAILSHLACVRRHLAPGGVYAVELELVDHDGPWTWRPEEGGEWEVPLPDGGSVHARWRRERCDRASRTCQERASFRHVAGGEALEEATHLYTMRMWTHDDLVRLTAAAGFRVREVHVAASDVRRVRTDLSRAAENDGQNRYYVLAPARD
jgi:SAM-dependent methyltransferase